MLPGFRYRHAVLVLLRSLHCNCLREQEALAQVTLVSLLG